MVVIVADFSSRDGWEQPILRFFDTLIGVAIGVATAWVSLRVIRPADQPCPAAWSL